jgi:hypothetical protein
MRKNILLLTALAILAGAPALTRAQDTNTPPASATDKVKPYPLNYCIVSGDKLGGDMGKPVVINYHGQEVKFCCKDCVKDFNKEPDKYLKQIQDAVAKGDLEKK